MAKGKTGLGRGLAALIPTTAPNVEAVDVDLIVANPRQPRTTLNPAALQELAESIREHGLLQPLLVTRQPGPLESPCYQVIAGERRWQAARLAGLSKVPVIVKEVTPQETLELALVENLQRMDLGPLEEAHAYRQLVDEFGLTQEQVARRVGKDRATVANSLRLLRLSAQIKDSLARGEITPGHARAILALPDAESRHTLWERILKFGLNVRQAEEAARQWESQPLTPTPKEIDPHIQEMEDRLRDALGTKVMLVPGRKGGKLIIHFYSDEELDAIYQRLMP
ncbi:MAG: ParB/RepB/Spo0J family partition protein [Chloroflexi bacterium]|nr:ParB/RepB/Spo0J family partition protein [Chloroflexota bacterium]